MAKLKVHWVLRGGSIQRKNHSRYREVQVHIDEGVLNGTIQEIPVGLDLLTISLPFPDTFEFYASP
jgi:hypothetical protein